MGHIERHEITPYKAVVTWIGGRVHLLVEYQGYRWQVEPISTSFPTEDIKQVCHVIEKHFRRFIGVTK